MSNDLDSLRTLVARATGTGWEAAYRQDVAALVAEVERLRSEVAELRALGVSLHKWAAMGRDAERAAVVAWLRERHVHTMEWDGRVNAVSRTYNHAANEIERGEHRRQENE